MCGRPYCAQGAKSGQFAYYICGTLFTEGAGTCTARYLNAPRVEDFVVEKIRERILTEETIVELVQLEAEEIDAMAGELSGRLEVVEAELGDVRKRLEKLYEAMETSDLTLEVLSPRIFLLRHREEQLEAARDDAERQLEQRRVELPNTEEIKEYVADFRNFLKEGTIPERKALIRNFVEGIEVLGDEATLTYTVPMPNDGVTSESASVLDFVQSGPPSGKVDRTDPFRATISAALPGIKLSSGIGTVYLRRASPGTTTISLIKDWMKALRSVSSLSSGSPSCPWRRPRWCSRRRGPSGAGPGPPSPAQRNTPDAPAALGAP